MPNRTMPLKNLTIAALAGSVLLRINQYDALTGNVKLRVIPAILNYCVPFFLLIAGSLSSIQEP